METYTQERPRNLDVELTDFLIHLPLADVSTRPDYAEPENISIPMTPLTPEERRPRGEDLGASFAEFLGAIKFLSGSTNKEMGDYLGVSDESIRAYLNGNSLPGKRVQATIKETFGLNDAELSSLLPRTSVHPLTPEERRARNEPLGRNFAEFLGAIKFLSGSSDVELASTLHVTSQQIHRYLLGEQKPRKDVVAKIIELFGLSDSETTSLFPEYMNVKPLTGAQRRARGEYLGIDFAEFLGTMKVLSGSSDSKIARQLGVSSQTVQRYLIGTRKPGKDVQHRVKTIFKLDNTEMQSLIMEPSRSSLNIPSNRTIGRVGNDWRRMASCRGVLPDIFYSSDNSAKTMKAKNICRTCLVASQCLATAISNREEEGVWGGTTSSQRKKMLEELPQAS